MNRLLGSVLLLGWLALGGAPVSAQTPPSPRIDQITFAGNRHLESDALESVMRLREPAWWNPFRTPTFPGKDFLASDLGEILLLYKDRGFPLARILDAVIRYNAAGDEVDIHIVIDEGPLVRVRDLDVLPVGETSLDPRVMREIRARLSVEPGDPVSQRALEEDRADIEDVFRERGHALVGVSQDLYFEGDRARVVFRIRPGPLVYVDSIAVAPMERTRTSFVRREVVLEPGDLLTPRRLAESRRRLLDTGVFRSVEIKPEFTDSVSARALLQVRGRERGRGWFGGGAGYSSADELRFSTEWGINNISGAGRRATLRSDLYYSLDPEFRGGGFNFKESLLRLDYLEPRLFDTRLRGSVSGYLQWLRQESFEDRIVGYSFAVRREIGLYTRLLVSVETRRVSTTEREISGDGTNVVLTEIPTYTTRFIRFDAAEDRRDNPINPSRGRYLSGHVDYAGGLLGGQNEFGRITGVWQAYASFLPGWVLAGRLRLGWIEPLSSGVGSSEQTPSNLEVARVPWEERFRLGGSNTIRGYAEDDVGRRNDLDEAIGGLTLLLGNVEIRVPLFWIVRMGLFVDFGNVWSDPAEIKLRRLVQGLGGDEYDPLNVFYGAGGGLRFVTPVGPLRVDYGYKLGSGRIPGQPESELHVALGQAF